MLVVIHSAPKNFANRKTIRETWAARKAILSYFVDFYFLIGKSGDILVEERIHYEYSKYDDIIQEDFWESYYNLTLKSLFMLKNVGKRCIGKTEYVLKIDDDMYLNTLKLVKELQSYESKDLILGHLIGSATPERDKRSKWYAPYRLYEDNYYPPFISGTAYVMSIDVVQRLLSASFNRPMYHLEDVYITGMLSKDIGVKPKDSSLFTHDKYYFSPCVYINLITSHGYTHTQLAKLYRRVTQSNLRKLCKKIYRPFLVWWCRVP